MPQLAYVRVCAGVSWRCVLVVTSSASELCEPCSHACTRVLQEVCNGNYTQHCRALQLTRYVVDTLHYHYYPSTDQ
jgi:hypothetical protein